MLRINNTGGFERINLSSSDVISIDGNTIYLNSSIFSGNIIINFLGIDYEEPIIYKDGGECLEDECEIVDYTRGEFLQASITGLITLEV